MRSLNWHGLWKEKKTRRPIFTAGNGHVTDTKRRRRRDNREVSDPFFVPEEIKTAERSGGSLREVRSYGGNARAHTRGSRRINGCRQRSGASIITSRRYRVITRGGTRTADTGRATLRTSKAF